MLGRGTPLARRAASHDEADSLRHRFWEALTASTGPDRRCEAETELIARLEAQLAERPEPELHSMLALMLCRRAQRRKQFDGTCIAHVEPHLRRAVELAPPRAIFRLNFAEALWRLGREAEAEAECRRALDSLQQAQGFGVDDLDIGHFPPAFDTFRVEWERAAWANAGAPRRELLAKRQLLQWRLHSMLAAITDDLAHYRAALGLREDLWVTHAAIGRALVRRGRYAAAARRLRRAADLNPFDEAILPDLVDALRRAGDVEGERGAADELRLLRRAAATTSSRDVAYAQEVLA
jgi:tetratricopeptide (TPR) repeat protein